MRHDDKNSGRCEYVLSDSAVQLERAMAALSYAVDECGDGLEKYGSAVGNGERQISACLDRHEKESEI